ncbi:hypothetical protein GALMADRAFT_276159, partial [Galerina marginata CBS 339.88]
MASTDLSETNPRTGLDSTDARTGTRHRKILRGWIACCIVFLVVAPLVSILLGLHLHARDFQYIPDENLSPPFDGRTVLMEVVLINADPLAGMMTMDWTIVGEEKSACSATNLGSCSDINIFFDNNLLRADNPMQLRSSDRPSQPIFRHNATAAALQDIVSNTPTFRTELALFSARTHQSSLIYYPFDEWVISTSHDTRDNNTMGLRFASTKGIATGFKTKAVTRQNVTIPVGMVDIVITLQRGNLVKTFSIVTVLAIWLITLILLLVMLTCVFFGFRQKGEVLVVPVATLFAFTQLRQSMPGAPSGFGDVLDFVGLLPCLALLSLSAALTLGAFILTDPTEKTQVLSWDLLFEAFPRLDPQRNQPNYKSKGSES